MIKALNRLYATLGTTIELGGKSLEVPKELQIDNAAITATGVSIKFTGSKPIARSSIAGIHFCKTINGISIDGTVVTLDIDGIPDIFDPTFDLTKLANRNSNRKPN